MCPARLLSPEVLGLSLSKLTYDERARANGLSKTVNLSSLARRLGLSAYLDHLGTTWLQQVDFGARVAMDTSSGLLVECFSFCRFREGLGRFVFEDAGPRELGRPQPVGGALHSVRISWVAAGTLFGLLFGLGAGAEGGLWSWGLNFFGQHCLGDTQYRATPTSVPGFDGLFLTWLAGYGDRAISDLCLWGESFEDPPALCRLAGPAEAPAPFLSASVGFYFGVAMGWLWWWFSFTGLTFARRIFALRRRTSDLTIEKGRTRPLRHAVHGSDLVLLARSAGGNGDKEPGFESQPTLVAGQGTVSTAPAGKGSSVKGRGLGLVSVHRPKVTRWRWVVLIALLLVGTLGFEYTQLAILTAEGDERRDINFGFSVALSGNYAVVGEEAEVGDLPGSAYVFATTDDGVTWTREAKLNASDPAVGDDFGRSVAIDGEVAVVGANGDGTSESEANTGAAYVFERSGGSWPQTAKLVADDASRYANFGYSVAVSGDLIVVGAWGWGQGHSRAIAESVGSLRAFRPKVELQRQ